MNTGTIKFFKEDKGYGFIINNETQTEIFVHATGLTGDVRKGDKVTYDVQDSKKGTVAVNVQVVK